MTATDADGDPITFQLGGTPPSGMAIDAVTGRITWSTTTAQAGQNVPVTVRAIDSFGAASADRNFTLAVQGDTQAPAVSVQFSVNPAPINSQVRFLVTATDNVG